jgi:xylulokinase
MARLFLGLDASTQSMSALVLDVDSGATVHELSINFEQTFPRYGVRNGVLPHPDPRVVHSSPLLWVEALVRVFDTLKAEGPPMAEIQAVSGSGQQHGSVYLNGSFDEALRALTPDDDVVARLRPALSRPTSPVWMDSSTTEECAEIEAALGGRAATAALTGSAACERFTGPQIRKFCKEDPAAYEQTAHIALVSSFLASVLCGRRAPVDFGDGAGMNLMDIERGQWSRAALDAEATRLAERLLPPVPSRTVLGGFAPAWVRRWGLSPQTRLVAWSGDNPSSLIGTGLIRPGLMAVSLGTSDTCFGPLSAPRSDPAGEGHVFGSPAGGYMSLICFKNGSLARERVRAEYGLSWDAFSQALRATPPGNDGALMLPWFEPEITPKVLHPRVHRHGLDPQNAAAHCRAAVEGQALAMRLHSAWMGVRPDRLYVTGGAAVNTEILQIIADVNQCPVYRHDVGNSAALGAALRAAEAVCADLDWNTLIERCAPPPARPAARHNPATAGLYEEAYRAYAAAETRALKSQGPE